jgi:hypothetical protein
VSTRPRARPWPLPSGQLSPTGRRCLLAAALSRLLNPPQARRLRAAELCTAGLCQAQVVRQVGVSPKHAQLACALAGRRHRLPAQPRTDPPLPGLANAKMTSVCAGHRLGGAPRAESNRRPHPYHESCGHRCADLRFRSSPVTVDRRVMCSTRAGSSCTSPASYATLIPATAAIKLGGNKAGRGAHVSLR